MYYRCVCCINFIIKQTNAFDQDWRVIKSNIRKLLFIQGELFIKLNTFKNVHRHTINWCASNGLNLKHQVFRILHNEYMTKIIWGVRKVIGSSYICVSLKNYGSTKFFFYFKFLHFSKTLYPNLGQWEFWEVVNTMSKQLFWRRTEF